MMLVPMDSINISATPSLSLMLKHTNQIHIQAKKKKKTLKKQTKTSHSTVQRAESVALNLLEHFLIQQHLHTRVISWKEGGRVCLDTHTHTHAQMCVSVPL